MDINMATLCAKGVLGRSSFLNNLKPSDMNLDLRITPTSGILLILLLYISPILSAIHTIASISVRDDFGHNWSKSSSIPSSPSYLL